MYGVSENLEQDEDSTTEKLFPKDHIRALLMPQILRGIICSVEVAAVAARANARERMRYIIMRWLGGVRAK